MAEALGERGYHDELAAAKRTRDVAQAAADVSQAAFDEQLGTIDIGQSAQMTAAAERAYRENLATHLQTFGQDLAATDHDLELALNQVQRDFTVAAGRSEAQLQYEHAAERASTLLAHSTAHPTDDLAHFNYVEADARADWHHDLIDDYGTFVADLATTRQTAGNSAAAARQSLNDASISADLDFAFALAAADEGYGNGLIGEQMGYLTSSVGTENEALITGAKAEAKRMLADAGSAKQYAVDLATIDKESVAASFTHSTSLTYNASVQQAQVYVNRTVSEGDSFMEHATSLAGVGKDFLLAQAGSDRTFAEGLTNLSHSYTTGLTGPTESWQNALLAADTDYLGSLAQAADTARASQSTAVTNFRSDDLAAAATAIDGIAPQLGNTPWSIYQGELADTVSSWWNNDGSVAQATWANEINLASDTFSTAHRTNLTTQLTAAAAADRVWSEEFAEAIRDLELAVAEADEALSQGMAGPIESYRITMAAASRDRQVAFAQAEVLQAQGDQQGYDDAVSAANTAYDHAVKGYEDSQGEHVDGIFDNYYASAESTRATFDLAFSTSLHDFEQLEADINYDWEIALESIEQALRDGESNAARNHTEEYATAQRDLLIAQSSSFATALDNLAATNSTPWSEYDAEKALVESAFLTDLANANHSLAVSKSTKIAGYALATSSARKDHAIGTSQQSRDQKQATATAEQERNNQESTDSSDLASQENRAAHTAPSHFQFGGANAQSLQVLPGDQKGQSHLHELLLSLFPNNHPTDALDVTNERGTADLTTRSNTHDHVDLEKPLPDNRPTYNHPLSYAEYEEFRKQQSELAKPIWNVLSAVGTSAIDVVGEAIQGRLMGVGALASIFSGRPAGTTTNFNNIPTERVNGLVADGLAYSYEDGRFVVISDRFGTHLNTLVLERIQDYRIDPITGGHGGSLPIPDGDHYEVVSMDSSPIAQLETYGVDIASVIERNRTAEAAERRIEFILDKRFARNINLGAQTVTFVYHALPFGAAFDNFAQGNYSEAGISLAGDAAFFLTGPLAGAAKAANLGRTAIALRSAGIGIEASIAGYRGYQGYLEVQDNNGYAAAGHFGEAALRLFGASTQAVQLARSMRSARALAQNSAVVTRSAEQAAIRQRVLGNIEASQRARASSRFDTWASTFDPRRMPQNAASTAFEARLPSSMYPNIAARLHFREANTQLLRAMDGDAQFARTIEDTIPGVRIQLQNPRSISMRPPRGWTWHHSVDEGVLQLVPRKQHWDPVLWRILHPNNQGGMSIWGGGY